MFSIQSSNHMPWHLLKGFENLCSKKICPQIFIATFIPNFQIVESTKIPFSRKVDRLWYILTIGYYSGLKEMSYQAMNK